MTEDQQTEVPAAEEPIVALYKFATWVHIGPGAENCEAVDEAKGEVTCGNPHHFHAWCRLPNQFQHREIREKALAAKARRVRQMRDSDSDAAVILEQEIDRMARLGDSAKPDIVEELAGKEWWRDYLEATQQVKDEEGEDGTKLYEHIDADIVRFGEIERMPVDDRPLDEMAELEKHVRAYNEAVEAARKAIEDPRREALMAREINDLLDMVRDQRVDLESNQAFQHEYAAYEWLTCTYRAPGGERIFRSREQMEQSEPDVVDALQTCFADLERTASGGGPGNS